MNYLSPSYKYAREGENVKRPLVSTMKVIRGEHNLKFYMERRNAHVLQFLRDRMDD